MHGHRPGQSARLHANHRARYFLDEGSSYATARLDARKQMEAPNPSSAKALATMDRQTDDQHVDPSSQPDQG
jgi:hypothetical protein